jgi:hypothetical protein
MVNEIFLSPACRADLPRQSPATAGACNAGEGGSRAKAGHLQNGLNGGKSPVNILRLSTTKK